MRKLLYLCLLVFGFYGCSSSDNEKSVDLSVISPIATHIGVDKVYLNGFGDGGDWYYKVKKSNGDFVKANYNVSQHGVIRGLLAATTYELIYKNSFSKSQIVTVTTKAFELDYKKNVEVNMCGAFDKYVLQGGKDYTFYTLNTLGNDVIDMYIISETSNDSIKVPTVIGADKKSFSFKVPLAYAKDQLVSNKNKVGFKVKDKMEYYYDEDYIKSENSDYTSQGIVNAKNYNGSAQRFYVENLQPFIKEVKVVRVKGEGYFYFDLTGNFYDIDGDNISGCNKAVAPVNTTVYIYLENTESTMLSSSRMIGDKISMDKPLSHIFSFKESGVLVPTMLPANEIRYYLDYFPKGNYLFQVKGMLPNGELFESNVVPLKIVENVTVWN